MNATANDSESPNKKSSIGWLAAAGCGVLAVCTCLCLSSAAGWYGLERSRDSSRRTQNIKNLRTIAAALHSYNDRLKILPAASIHNPKTQQPLLSWRVAILEELNEMELAKSIRMDESWDSEHNRKFWDRMPKVFQMPGKANDGNTYYQVFRGKRAVFQDGLLGTKYPWVTQGTSNTIMFVEAANPVNWMKPGDIHFQMDEAELMKHVGNHWGDDTFHAVFVDGTVHSLKRAMPATTLQALVIRDGNDVPPWKQWEIRR